MSAPVTLGRYLVDCRTFQYSPSFETRDVKLWILALDQLIAHYDLETATFAAPRLRDAFPATEYFQRMSSILDRLPGRCDDRAFAEFRHRSELEIDIAPRRGASAVVFAFAGRFGGLGLPPPLIHRWFGETFAHIVYLRDHASACYELGIGSLASTLTGTVDALRKIAEDLGVKRIAAFGNSLGGYGALRYALGLPASSVLVFGPVTNMTSAFNAERIGGRARFPEGVDLRPLYAQSQVRPSVRVVYGAGNDNDSLHAANLADIAGVTLDALAGYHGHELAVEAILQDRMGAYLRELVSG